MKLLKGANGTARMEAAERLKDLLSVLQRKTQELLRNLQVAALYNCRTVGGKKIYLIEMLIQTFKEEPKNLNVVVDHIFASDILIIKMLLV
ncbi:hypothetical protein ACSQ67_004771 [Phaseolus vulgaris]